MTRLNQLLGTILLAAATTTAAAGAATELAGVRVDGRDHAGVVTILTSGTFTHTEYRPTDSLMLVDLAGVSIAHPDTTLHNVSAPGVLSYRVVGYRYASGTEVARVELNLAPGAQVKVTEIAKGVEVTVGNGSLVPAEAPPAHGPAATATEMTAKSAVTAPSSIGTSHIRNISVARGKEGLNIEITADGPITGKTMKLSGPDRLVLDIPNSILEGTNKREIPVNSNSVKDVRAARYQSAPPATRVVVDLASARDFEVVSSANRLVLQMKDPVSALPMSPAPATKREDKPQMATQSVLASTKPIEPGKVNQTSANPSAETPKAANLGVVTPVFPSRQNQKAVQPKQDGKAAENIENNTDQSRASLAAAHFSVAGPTAPATNQPPFPSSASLAATPAVMNAALQRQQTSAPGTPAQISGCTTGRYTGEPFSMNVKDLDLKDFFRLIHEISGLNIVLDPAVHGTLTIVLDDVPWDQALAIVLSNNNLDCQLQGNVLRIATVDTLKSEAESRHAQQDAQALAVPTQTVTRYLSYGHAKDVATIVKKFLSARGNIVADDRSNALIIEDIPSTIPKVDGLLPLLDRKTPEVEIEARVVSASRNFARDIGTQLAPGFANGHSAIGGISAVGDSPIITTVSTPPVPPSTTPTVTPTTGNLLGSTANKGAIPLFSNLAAAATSGFTFSTVTQNFRLDFLLTMAESRGLAKILSRPTVTTQNNVKAVIKQGQKIPITTPGQLGGPPTVTYLDVVLRLSVTPQITAENTIFLDIDVEDTTIAVSAVAAANPTLNTAQATTQVLVNDGGTVVIGGVINTQNTISVQQVPLLGSIPILGNLFKRTSVSTATTELIFFITPKIVQT
ncbi:MAG TPA: type IV pilus secretin PilQ [Verrucomicrobiae bacterium]|jgi:type IV pilus secretin PilQ/predicted competence protein|nr:type IV pilus secretin PilQ [Verrucomicrobiae bacterium]